MSNAGPGIVCVDEAGVCHALGRGVWAVSEDPVEACLPWHGRRADA